MPRTDDVNPTMVAAVRKSLAIERWAERAGIDLDGADDVFRSATWIIEEMQASGTHPVYGLHTAMILFMMVAAACDLGHDDAREFWNRFADRAWAAARASIEAGERRAPEGSAIKLPVRG